MPGVAPRLLDRRAWLFRAASAGTSALLAARAGHADKPVKRDTGIVSKSRIKVSLNESPFGPSPRVLHALKLELRGLERYTGEEAGALTRQIAELEGVAEEQVLLGEVLEPLGLQLGLDGGRGGEFAYSEPGYTALVDAARPVGGVGVAIPLNSRLENDLPAFASKLSARSRAVFLVNPHNPSGTVSDAAEFKSALSELAKRTLVIVDEAYLDYLDDWQERSAVELIRNGQNLIVFRTFSKLHGLAALPLGYAITPRKLGDDLRRRGLGNPRSLNRLAVRAAAVSLRDTDHVARVRAQVKAERTQYHAVLTQLGLRFSAAQASFVFFESKRAQGELAALLAAQGIEIGRGFPPLSNWTRVSIGLPSENREVQRALRLALAETAK